MRWISSGTGTEKGTSLIFNVRTSQSYSGTLPVNVTVANPGGVDKFRGHNTGIDKIGGL